MFKFSVLLLDIGTPLMQRKARYICIINRSLLYCQAGELLQVEVEDAANKVVTSFARR